MRMALFYCLLTGLSVTQAQADAAQLGATSTRKTAQQVSQVPRCAYLGRWGSFHLLGKNGSAAYITDTGEYIDELDVAARHDPLWWRYRARQSPSTSDHVTEMWAFARQPDCYGRYWVLRYSRGAWRPYESTYFWGVTEGEAGASAATTSYSDAMRASEIPGITGINGVKLLEAITAAMRSQAVGLNVDDASPPVIRGNRITVTARLTAVDNAQLRHRIIATIEGDRDQISLTVSSQGFANGAQFEVEQRVPELVAKKLKQALAGQ